VRPRQLDDLLTRQRRMPERGGGVHGEHDGTDPALPVVVGDVGHGRGPVGVPLGVRRRRIQKLLVERTAPGGVLLDVDVGVDGDERGEIPAHAGPGSSDVPTSGTVCDDVRIMTQLSVTSVGSPGTVGQPPT